MDAPGGEAGQLPEAGCPVEREAHAFRPMGCPGVAETLPWAWGLKTGTDASWS